ncbi:hypothetical protein ASZ78_002640 [Callipepla squamata]|uniref:E3 ubiquitin-protein ligase Topors n=1 Tax=Callipepla squamata TaxID=9009 RepID=A0A226MVQ7_CALSU|nr:hypothetical protein ASZ78_002640 [Callipepla squamata]
MPTVPGDTFSDTTCPICMDSFDNVAYLGYCWHRFCFPCIQKWSQTSVECPLCKQPFSSIFHSVHAEDDFQEYKVRPLEEDALSSSESSTTTAPHSAWDLDRDDLHDNDDDLTPSQDEGSGSDPTDSTTCHGSERSSSLSGDDQSPSDDETPGPSSFISTTSLWVSSEHSHGTCACMRTTMHSQFHDSDSSSSDSSLEHRGPGLCINFCAKGSLSMLFSDSEDSSEEEKGEDEKEEESDLCCSWSDDESSRASSPPSPLYKDHGSCCQSPLSSAVNRTISTDEQKNQEKVTDPSPNDSVWSLPPGMEDICSSRRQKLFRKTGTLQACPQDSDDGHDHRPRRERHSEQQLKRRRSRSRDGNKRPSKRSRRARPRDASLSLASQRDSRSSESTTSRDSSRSRSPHEGHDQRKSSRRHSDRRYRRACYCRGCKGHYPSYHHKTARDGSSCSKGTESPHHRSGETADPEFGTQSPTQTTDLQSHSGLRERQDSCYERRRSRSRSSTTSSSSSGETDRTRSKKPRGKRKYKPRHLEKAEEGSTALQGQNGLKRTFREGSHTDEQASSGTPPKKKKEETSEQGESDKEKKQAP